MEIQSHKHSYNKGKNICNGLSIQDPIYRPWEGTG